MKTRSPAAELFSQVAVKILFLNGLLEASGDALSKKSNQTSARWRVLACLQQQSRTVAAIGRSLGCTRQSVQRLSNLLVAEKTARFRKNPDDARADLLEITATGRTALSSIQRQQVIWAERHAAALGVRQLTALLDGLTALSTTLTKEHP